MSSQKNKSDAEKKIEAAGFIVVPVAGQDQHEKQTCEAFVIQTDKRVTVESLMFHAIPKKDLNATERSQLIAAQTAYCDASSTEKMEKLATFCNLLDKLSAPASPRLLQSAKPVDQFKQNLPAPVKIQLQQYQDAQKQQASLSAAAAPPPK